MYRRGSISQFRIVLFALCDREGPDSLSSELMTCWLFESVSGKGAPLISSETAETLMGAGSLQTPLVSCDSLFDWLTTPGQLGSSDNDVLQDWRWSFVASFSFKNVCSHFVGVPRIPSEKLTRPLRLERLEERFSFAVAFDPANQDKNNKYFSASSTSCLKRFPS